jgi:predicted aspartyl protease
MAREHDIFDLFTASSIAPLFTAILIMPFTPDVSHAADDTGQQVPIFDDGTMIRVPVKVFGEKLYFIVDTGFTVSAIDTKYAQHLGEPITQYRVSTPLTADHTLPIYNCPQIFLGEKSLELDKISCTDLTMARLISGQQCDGVLGMDFFAKNVVSIDFDKKVLSLLAKVPGTIKSSSVVIPLNPLFEHYAAKVSINKTRNFDLLIDTGDNSSISLNSADWQDVFSTNQANVFTATIAAINNQVAQSKIGRLELLTIQGHDYTNLHATFIHNPSDPSHLGLNFFRRHKVTFDFANQVLYLEPGQQFSTPDKEDMSGLHLLRDDAVTIVYSVDEKSPAFDCGIKPKDIIESVNGQKTSLLKIYAIRLILQSHEGDKVIVQVRRGDDLLDFKFALKKAI